jgi:hypothetical protein
MVNRTLELPPGLMEARGMKMIGANHLDPEHRSILSSEAETVEDVRDVLYESGFIHGCDGRIFPTTPLPEMHKWAVAQERSRRPRNIRVLRRRVREITKIPCLHRNRVSNECLNFNRSFDKPSEVRHAGDALDAADRRVGAGSAALSALWQADVA